MNGQNFGIDHRQNANFGQAENVGESSMDFTYHTLSYIQGVVKDVKSLKLATLYLCFKLATVYLCFK